MWRKYRSMSDHLRKAGQHAAWKFRGDKCWAHTLLPIWWAESMRWVLHRPLPAEAVSKYATLMSGALHHQAMDAPLDNMLFPDLRGPSSDG